MAEDQLQPLLVRTLISNLSWKDSPFSLQYHSSSKQRMALYTIIVFHPNHQILIHVIPDKSLDLILASDLQKKHMTTS